MGRFTVIGAGALGTLFAVRLSEAGHEVEVVVRRAERKAEIEAAGLRLIDAVSRSEEQSARAVITAFPRVRLWGEEEAFGENNGREPHFILLAVKQSAITGELGLELGRRMGSSAWVVCLQNGIGHLETLAAHVPAERLLSAVTTEGAMISTAGEAVYTGCGMTWVGAAGKERTEVSEIAQKNLVFWLQLAGFSASMSKNISSRIWQKLLINAVINPLTALLRVPNGELLNLPGAGELMRALYEEGVTLARALDIRLEPDLWEQLLEVCRRTANNRSSMLQDVMAGRLTEIDAITGGLLRVADRSGIALPTHLTVYRLIKATEGHRL
ncbi:2-dehydropantoate 2-reductase [Paenibacillus sp. MZ04-78.2]|uniref:ketopantoate reductase family protein n=1 Tax=Paenibacillus sp. MZ04-78.2 TaxID=2962034 RepID=UPI0020B67A0B|nr:2-dehydropantoate 2-reductase [Paenibacillus sp. MZ04-78.2]MCP3771969.1 2-dehydropantoate 2-reductase [Paenibacillus sp. MZ04-78.2]